MARLEGDRTPCAGITQIRFEGLLPDRWPVALSALRAPLSDIQLAFLPSTLAVPARTRQWRPVVVWLTSRTGRAG